MASNAVPKFGSFKPKTKSESKQDSKPDSRSSGRSSHHKAKERSLPDDGRTRRREHDDSHGRQTSSLDKKHAEALWEPERKHQKLTDAPRAAELDEFEESTQFIVDRRGDAKNAVYGSLHRYNIPAYHRTGYGNVIGGLSSKIDREASDGKEVSLVSSLKPRVRSNSSRVLSSKYGKDSETKLRFITAQSDQADDRPGSDFIEITRAKRREHDYDGADDQSGSVDYRSIDGKAKANDPSIDDDLEVVDSDDNASTDLELRTRQESAVLSKKAKANPKSLEAWLALAEHQSKLVRPGIDVSSLTSSERRTLADLRLSIFNEASKHISPGTAGRESLLSAMVDEGRLVWDNAKLASKWKEALVEQNSSVLLWAKYLNFVQDSQSNFRYETCKHAYVECLNILHRACESANDASRPEISRIQIYLLLRFTVFVRGAGYDELAIAIWQALIEMHFFAPSSLSSAGVSERLSSLEEFWESEVARVGEENSLGWAKYHDSGEGTPRESQPAVKDKTVLCNSLQNFADEENTLGSAFLLPASTYDDDAVTDPFRCVMFSDIREVIEPLSNTKIQSWSIVESFFHFMRLPAISLQSIHLDACEWQRDSHLATSPGENSSFAATPQPERCLLPCRREMTAILFEDGFDALKSDLEQQPMRDTKLRFLDRVLESLGSVSTLNTPNGELLAEYYIAFKATLLPTETAKAAKRILKQRPSSMRLYNAYALAEGRSQMAKALEIWSAALSLQRRIESNQHHDLIYLWHSRFICQVKSGDERGALQLLLDTANGNKECIGVEDQSDHASEFSTRQLRLLRRIEEDLDRLYLLGRFEHAVLCADLLAWISYLTTENNTDRPLHIYSKYSAKFARDKGSIAIEQLHQCKVRLIQTHLERHRPHKPSVLQQELEDSLELFPDNSVLLELHARIATQDRIRALVREQKATSSISSFSVVQWAFKIGEEIRRSAHETSGSTSNTVRAAFSNALLRNDSTVSHSPALWLAWSRYEFASAGTNMQRARSVFLDGLRYLPWMKSWAIQGMKLFGDGTLSQSEMKQLYELLHERGLRVRVDVEKLL
ncbi:unnamed protein product [Zymoseptoria tritici ST99CH_3D1]|uniref:DUF1740-domain-containing protein n=1 Tax=Zymoseptoria tritici ST99CH_1E4 TaxID=1276532 RepID=A0A2H1FXT1_ZYMTR|nr:unnamed protein product [Zymoseptoria tritici ST99CH_1E4]SMR47361.1 unnamed protein product [Zymoseptoria tritici ST99CH_3D1]